MRFKKHRRHRKIMRFKKHRRHRKIVRFLTTCFGFRKPFKVLCDGTFIHHLLVNRIVPADQAISNLLGGPVKLYTTRCVLAELKRLGHSHSRSLEAARNLMIASCEHEKVKAADACFMEVIGETNPDHFFVATQDSDLRNKFQKMPGVPTLFGLRNALFLDPISKSQREFVNKLENKRSHLTMLENNLLKMRAKNLVASMGEDDSDDEEEESEDQNLPLQGVKKEHPKRKGMEVKDRVQFKRKRAKGPNPLSCKKKKNPEKKNPTKIEKKEDGTTNAIRSRRKRKRSGKQKQAVQVDN